jgi:hypothetical protein
MESSFHPIDPGLKRTRGNSAPWVKPCVLNKPLRTDRRFGCCVQDRTSPATSARRRAFPVRRSFVASGRQTLRWTTLTRRGLRGWQLVTRSATTFDSIDGRDAGRLKQAGPAETRSARVLFSAREHGPCTFLHPCMRLDSDRKAVPGATEASLLRSRSTTRH